jgi:hypothetical protein
VSQPSARPRSGVDDRFARTSTILCAAQMCLERLGIAVPARPRERPESARLSHSVGLGRARTDASLRPFLEPSRGARNFKPWMSKGLWLGSLMFGIDQTLLRGKAPAPLVSGARHVGHRDGPRRHVAGAGSSTAKQERRSRTALLPP